MDADQRRAGVDSVDDARLAHDGRPASRAPRLADADLVGKRLAAVAHSSGAKYLDARRLGYASFDDLPAALAALESRKTDAVVNSIGALQYLIAARFKRTIETPRGVLAPAYMAFALRFAWPEQLLPRSFFAPDPETVERLREAAQRVPSTMKPPPWLL